MKAAFLNETGAPSVIQFGELPDPKPASDEILIRTRAVAVNPIDTYIRSGAVAQELPQPYVPGCDFAGVVEAVGSNVTRFQAGDRVWGSNQGLFGQQGTFSELAAVNAQWAYPLPDPVSFNDAAAIALTGITAHLGLHLHGSLQTGEVVFVNGGTGGVGSAVVQLAKAAGATVIATAGNEAKLETARKLGADFALNYRDDLEGQLDRTLAETGPVNLWFETQRNPNPEFTIPRLAKRGRYILMAGRDAQPPFPVGPFYVKDLRTIGFAMFNASAEEQAVCAAEMNKRLADGTLRPLVGATMPLSDAAAAHELQEANTLHGAGTLTGKIVLTTGEDELPS